ncbi:MAG: DEAD/DEAH box helicase, partial [Armatimonadota bacterium]
AAIEDVRADLERPKPMDRLVCGDVGFGKTEVAVRAAFMVASEGRQVAVLCPTTVLAAQHHQTFMERLGAFPVCIDSLSRFRSAKEQQRTIDAIRSGAADIVVGTHRLLSKDVEFKDLGLVIVDEEQRFGVVHKERLKQLRTTVDVLTLTATPIPRTMHMALSGIRDMSLIHDPPEGRLPVRTYIKESDDLLIREAILQEIARGGQVYFIHNRIESIQHVAHRIERIVPGARVRVAHGQMGEDALEETMFDFYQRKFDVLVCTTIVESGLDIPSVNTIVVDHADKLGLAQLYQLRGRVGRSRQQAYAYLLYPRAKALSTVAEQRLDALREFSELGSGYKVALRDLEIRGAGNLLGAQQSGSVAAVGFDLYCQLLEDAIRENRGQAPDAAHVPLPTVEIPVPAAIPVKYVASEPQRIQMYKKLAAVRDRADVARLQEEFEDRFGDPPPPVWNALGLLRLRLRCSEVGIESIGTEGRTVVVQLLEALELPRHAIRRLTSVHRGAGHVFEPRKVALQIGTAKVLPWVEEMVETLVAAANEPAPVAPSRPVRPSYRDRR